MKKICAIFLLFLLAGCVNDKLEIIEVDRNYYGSGVGSSIPITIAENGIYYVSNQRLFYKGDNERAVPLGYVNYLDGEKTNLVEQQYKINIKVDSFIGQELICYGDRIYMLYMSENHDMSTVYQLSSHNLKGEDYQVHITFDYLPQKIKINNGKIYVAYLNYETNENYIEIYDKNYRLINTEYYDKDIIGFYIENDEIIVPDNLTIYANDNTKLSYKVENIYSDQDRKAIGKIQIDDKEFVFENKYVLFVNDKYFYTASCKSPQIYERYHLNGELDKSIVISEYIEAEENLNGLFELDFSYMLNLRNEDITYGYSGKHYPRIFEVNFEKGTCYYVDK